MEAQHHKPKILKSYIKHRRKIQRERDDEGKTEFLQVKKRDFEHERESKTRSLKKRCKDRIHGKRKLQGNKENLDPSLFPAKEILWFRFRFRFPYLVYLQLVKTLTLNMIINNILGHELGQTQRPIGVGQATVPGLGLKRPAQSGIVGWSKFDM